LGPIALLFLPRGVFKESSPIDGRNLRRKIHPPRSLRPNHLRAHNPQVSFFHDPLRAEGQWKSRFDPSFAVAPQYFQFQHISTHDCTIECKTTSVVTDVSCSPSGMKFCIGIVLPHNFQRELQRYALALSAIILRLFGQLLPVYSYVCLIVHEFPTARSRCGTGPQPRRFISQMWARQLPLEESSTR